MPDNKKSISTQRSHHASMSVNPSKMFRSGPEKTQSFLNVHNQYVNELEALSSKIGDEYISTEYNK